MWSTTYLIPLSIEQGPPGVRGLRGESGLPGFDGTPGPKVSSIKQIAFQFRICRIDTKAE